MDARVEHTAVQFGFPRIGALRRCARYSGRSEFRGTPTSTPPFGLLLFIMLGVAPPGTTLGQVACAAALYLFCDAILVALLIIYPQIALYLPGLIG